MSITVSSITFSNTSDAFTDTVGKYWLSCTVEGSKEQWQEVIAPATDGAFMKPQGFRGRGINLTVVYVGATSAAVRTAFKSDLSTLEQVQFTFTDDGSNAYPKCILETANALSGPRGMGNGLFMMIVNFKLEQKALA